MVTTATAKATTATTTTQQQQERESKATLENLQFDLLWKDEIGRRCQSNQRWKRIKGNTRETSKRRGRTHMGFQERLEISPRGLTFTWLGCRCLCFWHKPTELAHSFLFCSSVYFGFYRPFNCISFLKFSHFLTLFFRSYICLIGLFKYVSLYESLLQPWCNPLWLNGLKAPTN